MVWIAFTFLGLVALAILYYFAVYERSSVFDKALQLAEEGDYTDARAIIRNKIRKDPTNPKAHYAMAQVYALEGNEDGELEHLQEIYDAGQVVPDFPTPRLLNRIAEIEYAKGKYQDSYLHFQESLKLVPKNEAALAHMAFMAIGQGQFEVAEKFFQKLIEIAPEIPPYRIARGVGLAMLGKEDALTELEHGLKLDPTNLTSKFLVAYQSLKANQGRKAKDLIGQISEESEDIYIKYLCLKLICAVEYQLRDYESALQAAQKCLDLTLREGWEKEEYDARLAISYMAMLVGELDLANENLLELEIRNPTDQLVMKISDFRMDLEEGAATVDTVSARGFDFPHHMNDWLRNRFPSGLIYLVSGLKMEEKFDIDSMAGKPPPRRRQVSQDVDPEEMIDKFNALQGIAYETACEKIIETLGYRKERNLPNRDGDGLDILGRDMQDKKIKALFQFRKWKNQPISDIFLRNMQNTMNELKASKGFVVAGARLTQGAESALENLKKINVINEEELAGIVQSVLGA
jgi:tetratricopeptide (TPR) repeat protein